MSRDRFVDGRERVDRVGDVVQLGVGLGRVEVDDARRSATRANDVVPSKVAVDDVATSVVLGRSREAGLDKRQ